MIRKIDRPFGYLWDKKLTDRILVTLGPSSLSQGIIKECSDLGVHLFRLNLSHTPLDGLEETVERILSWTDVPLSLDSEGAQLRNHAMVGDAVFYSEGTTVLVHFREVLGDEKNISFRPLNVVRQFRVGDEIGVDFNHVTMKVTDLAPEHCLAEIIQGGVVGSNKAADLGRDLEFDPLTEKDRAAIEIGRAMGLKHYAMSFTNSAEDARLLRSLAGPEANIMCKIESPKGVRNLEDILQAADEIIIDRGDLSRRVAIEKIPFLQRRIISLARARRTPIYVATNLMESMVTTQSPNRAEVNDVVSTLEMGANGLVLAAETAIGRFPVQAVRMVRTLMDETDKWTPNTSLDEILDM